MQTREKIKLHLLIIYMFTVVILNGQTLIGERPYEPVMIEGKNATILKDFLVSSLHLYAYDSKDNSWSAMPFQIDEVLKIETEEDTTWSFYIPDTDPKFDGNDQLVFMIRDMGDKADESDWIDHPDANQRVEIKLFDSTDTNIEAYAYVYISSTLNDPVPRPYAFAYDSLNNTIQTSNYKVKINQEYGYLEDIQIMPPLGNGVDFLDRLKFRFVGIMKFLFGSVGFGKEGIPAASEYNLVTITDKNSPYYFHEYTKEPVVRFIREVKSAIQIERILDEFSFRNEIMFYPYSASISGGAGLTEEDIQAVAGTEESLEIEVNYLRQSWDLNSQAAGMKFFNEANENITIDGNPDGSVNTSLTNPNHCWTMVSGAPGSFFSFLSFTNESWENTGLYYYDNKNGGQGDLTSDQGDDTGDGASYGDHGVSLFNNDSGRPVDITLNLNAYFLPSNLTKANGEKLYNQLNHPLGRVLTLQQMTHVADDILQPASFQLKAAYPNPFNGSTQVEFSLSKTCHVTAKIYDTMGREIRTLLSENRQAGNHLIQWDGLDNKQSVVSSGLYFLRIQAAGSVQTEKLLYTQ